MTHPKILITDTYGRRLSTIEEFILSSSENSILALEKFYEEHDRVLDFLSLNPTIPSENPKTGDRSWPFNDGRYRLFFTIIHNTIYLSDLIDNRMSNLHIYPENTMQTFSEE